MLLPLVERFVSERRNGLVGWAIGLSLYAILIVSVFPAVRDSDSYAAALDDYPDALKELFGGEAAFQLTTAAGFLHAEVYALILPLLLSVVAIGAGAGLGADQRSGLMDLLLANPVPRRSVIVAKAAAMTIAVSGLSIVVLVTILLAGTFVSLELGVAPLLAATTATVFLVLFHGLVALGVAAGTGSRSASIGAATTLFAGGYILNALGGLVPGIEPFRVLSPYHHAIGPNPLLEGWAAGSLGVLAALCLSALLGSVIAFDQRQLT